MKEEMARPLATAEMDLMVKRLLKVGMRDYGRGIEVMISMMGEKRGSGRAIL